jgi:hypothetical protein|tara:strand:+ start:7362 stop:7649 length:288 start_codon:yes stop_codon:yes gene_type:complete
MNKKDMDLHNIIEEIVMGVLDKQKAQNKVQQNRTTTQPTPTHNPPQPKPTPQQLTQLIPSELKYLITLIGKSDFKGSDLQIIYSITAKLQNQLKQ